jgi:hypothetical protein
MGDDVSSDPRTLPTPRPPPARADGSVIRLTHCGGMAERTEVAAARYHPSALRSRHGSLRADDDQWPGV